MEEPLQSHQNLVYIAFTFRVWTFHTWLPVSPFPSSKVLQPYYVLLDALFFMTGRGAIQALNNVQKPEGKKRTRHQQRHTYSQPFIYVFTRQQVTTPALSRTKADQVIVVVCCQAVDQGVLRLVASCGVLHSRQSKSETPRTYELQTGLKA